MDCADRRDYSRLLIHNDTLSCAMGSCIPCLYKIAPKGEFSLPSDEKVRLPPNQRPEMCFRSKSTQYNGIYSPNLNILTVGDGGMNKSIIFSSFAEIFSSNFSFSQSLSSIFTKKSSTGRLVCSSHESKTSLLRTYPNIQQTLNQLSQPSFKVSVLHDIDATQLHLPETQRRLGFPSTMIGSSSSPSSYYSSNDPFFDVVIWNFPCVRVGQMREIEENKRLLQSFFRSVSSVLKSWEGEREGEREGGGNRDDKDEKEEKEMENHLKEEIEEEEGGVEELEVGNLKKKRKKEKKKQEKKKEKKDKKRNRIDQTKHIKGEEEEKENEGEEKEEIEGDDEENKEEGEIKIRIPSNSSSSTPTTTTTATHKVYRGEVYRGEVHITHKTLDPFHWWGMRTIGEEEGFVCVGVMIFDKYLYPGYVNRKVLDKKSFPSHDALTYVFVHKSTLPPSILSSLSSSPSSISPLSLASFSPILSQLLPLHPSPSDKTTINSSRSSSSSSSSSSLVCLGEKETWEKFCQHIKAFL